MAKDNKNVVAAAGVVAAIGKALKDSKNTTIAAIAGLVVLAANAATAMYDGDPATVVDWSATAVAAIALAGLLFAKDGHKSD